MPKRIPGEMQADINRLRHLLRKRPYTLTEIMHHTGRSRSTAYRYLALMKGVERIGMQRPTKYKVKK